MNLIYRKWGFAFFTFAIVFQFEAQQPWAYEELVNTVLTDHPDVVGERLRQDALEQQKKAGLAPGPLQVTGFFMPGLNAQPSNYAEGQIDFPLTSPALARKRRELGEIYGQTAEASTAEVAQSARLAVEYHVLEWVDADARARLWAKHLEMSQDLVDWFVAREAAGEARSVDRQAAELRLRRADHEHHVATLRKEDIEARLAWLSGNDGLTLGAVEAPPLELDLDDPAALLALRLTGDASLGRLRADTMEAVGLEDWARLTARPQIHLGYNIQGIAGDLYQGPVASLSIPLGAARLNRAAAAGHRAAVTWELERSTSELVMEFSRLLARFEARHEHHSTWKEQLSRNEGLASGAQSLYQQQLLDMPTFYALWQAELEGQLELLECEADIRWLRAQILLGVSTLPTFNP
jgi:hypothetical protein